MAVKRDPQSEGFSEAITVRPPAAAPKDPTTRSGRKRPGKAKLTPEGEVEAYLAALEVDQHTAMQRVRKIIKDMLPGVGEKLSFQVPTFIHEGPLVGYSASKKLHCSFFVMSRAIMEAYQAELAPYYTGPGTLRFSHSEPLPTALIKKIVQARVAENEAKKAASQS